VLAMLIRLPFALSRVKKLVLAAVVFSAFSASSAFAQTNSILLFGPVDVRLSTTGTGTTIATGNNFNTTNLNLTCPASPTATLSSTADGTGNVLVDNFLNVTVTSNGTTAGPTNVCPGGGTLSCFSPGYQVPASTGSLAGEDPDTFVSTGGVSPISIGQLLTQGPVQLQVALEDVGYGNNFFLASSTLYLDTNCTPGGVTGPALVNGNPISGTTPTPQQLTQDFSFNPLTGQEIGFEYDLSTAQQQGTLTINEGTIPQVSDSPLDPSIFQSTLAAGTSFATSSCIIHAGELLPSGAAACKVFTLQCSVGTGASATGAQCPVSTVNNEIFQDVFSGPGFTLSDIPTPNGPTFHEGIGLLMASDGWPGGACSFNAEADLGNLNCPQNLLTSFTSSSDSADAAVRKAAAKVSPAASKAQVAVHSNAVKSGGVTISTGSTTRPNSTFISVAQVPEDLTTVTVAGQKPGYWVNTPNPSFTLSSQPPNLSGTTLAGAANFVPSPIQSITYGISPASNVPAAGSPVIGDTTLTNSVGCPTPPNLTTPAATTFTPDPIALQGLADGTYLVHYFAQDCAGTEELLFTQDGNGNWSTNFYTYPLNVDTTAPVVSSGPVLSPVQATYTVGQTVTASFSCTDALSGVVQCSSYTYAVGATNNTGTLTSPVDTSSPGSKTFTVTAVDAAGNTSLMSANYQVVSPYDNQVQFSITPNTVTYPQGANVVVQVVPGASPAVASHTLGKSASSNRSAAITGTVEVYDGAKLLATLGLQGNGAAYDYISGLSAGQHSLTAAYSGDGAIAGGTSAPVTFTVQPAPVNLGVFCWNGNFPYGADYTCGAYTSSNAGPALGKITYAYDSNAPVSVPLEWGVGIFNIVKPAVGQHQVVVSYAAQGNFAAATPQTESFTVTPAPVLVSLTPSSWYLTGGNLTLSASVSSWSAGPPRGTGSVTFSHGGIVLAVVPVDANGRASLTVSSSTLANGNQTFAASYAGGTNYASGSGSVTISVAKH
jgi:hypothetical protein